MNIVVLGSGGYYPTDDQHTASYMIPELGVIFDCGSGIFRASKFIKTSELHIFISHPHADHIDGLKCVKNLYSSNCNRIVLYGLKETIEAIAILFKKPFSGQTLIPFELRTIDFNEVIKFPEFEMRTFPVEHVSPCIGFRIDSGGKSVAYITDSSSSVDSDYGKHVKKVDFLLHEAYYPHDMEEKAIQGGHSTSSMVVQFCKANEIENVLLIHHHPDGSGKKVFEEVKEHLPFSQNATDYSVYKI